VFDLLDFFLRHRFAFGFARRFLFPELPLGFLEKNIVDKISVALVLVGHNRWVRIASEFKDASSAVPLSRVDARISSGRLEHSRRRQFAVLEPRAEDFEEFVDDGFVEEPVVSHLHRRLVLVTVSDRV
jgi:hypothetical protein